MGRGRVGGGRVEVWKCIREARMTEDESRLIGVFCLIFTSNLKPGGGGQIVLFTFLCMLLFMNHAKKDLCSNCYQNWIVWMISV